MLKFPHCILKAPQLSIQVPHWATVEQFCVNGFFNGFFTSAIVVMVNVWLNELWSWSARRRKMEEKLRNRGNLPRYLVDPDSQLNEERSKIDIGNVLMQALHFFFGVGCILGPILAEPFLQNAFTGNDGFFSNCLVLPYTIASSTAVISSLSFFLLFLVCPYEQPNSATNESEDSSDDEARLISAESNEDISSDKRPVPRHLRYMIIFSSALFLFVFLCSVGSFIFTVKTLI